MRLFDLVTADEALDDLLNRERRAIIDGRLDQLERLAKEKERFVGLLPNSNTGPATLEALRHKIERNSKLLQAAQQGLMNAQRLIGALQKPKPALQTYDRLGRKQLHSVSNSQNEHRA